MVGCCRRTWPRAFLHLAMAAALVALPSRRAIGDGPASPSPDIFLRDGLAIGPVGTSARSPVHTDAIEARIVAGTWAAPKEGDKVALPDGTSKAWSPVKANDKGEFEGQAFEGGAYVSFRVTSAAEEVRLLAASGD